MSLNMSHDSAKPFAPVTDAARPVEAETSAETEPNVQDTLNFDPVDYAEASSGAVYGCVIV